MIKKDLEPYSIVSELPITLNGIPLLCNQYMNLNSDLFLHIFSGSNKDNELLIIHPGTDRILSSAIVSAAFACVLDGTVDLKEYYEQFSPGCPVIRRGERYRFDGIEEGMCILASDDTSTTSNSLTKIPLKRGLDIRPYFGSSSRTGRQGTVRSYLDASEYLQRIVGEQYRDQAITMPLCMLVVCPKETAYRIADNLMFADENRFYRFADAFPFAWVRSIDDYEVFFGAVGKPDPAVLFTNRISLARELLYDDLDFLKRISTVILYDIEPHAAPESEIHDIREQVNRRKNSHLITLQSASKVSEVMNSFIDERVQTVVWSSALLLSTIDDLYHEPMNKDDQTIMEAINRTIDSTVERITVPVSKALADIKVCKSLLKQLISSNNRTFNIDEFILCAYGLLNLFEQASFTMSEYENSISEGFVRARSPGKQIEKLYELINIFGDASLIDKAESIYLMLAEAYSSLYDANPKREALLHYVAKTREYEKSFHIIVPKRSYIDVVCKICGCMDSENVSVPARIKHGINVERLIITATLNVKEDGYNPLSGRAVNETILFEYESEALKNDCYQRLIDRAFAQINSTARISAATLFDITLEDEDFTPAKNCSDTELDEVEQIDIELNNIEIEATIGRDVDRNQPGSTPIRAIRLAQFDTSEWAMFSQYYTVYVFDSSTEKLIEKSPVDLCVGDIVVFSTIGSEITDFVDEILRHLILRGNHVLEENYERTRRWKQVLKDYIKANSLTYQNISDRMRDYGYPRHPATIGTWLREDSSIIGPRDVDTFIAIGLAADNEEIVDNASLYKRSCDVIRSQRMKILSYVQSSIIHSTARRGEEAGEASLTEDEKSYLGDASKYARKLGIDRIMPCERYLPAHLVNRPVGRLNN